MSLTPLRLGLGSASRAGRPVAVSAVALLGGAALLGLAPAATLLLAWLAPGGDIDPVKLVGLCAAPVVFLVTLLEVRAGIGLFIVASGLSPEIAGIENVRFGDFVFLLLLFAVVARLALGRTQFELRSPFTAPTVATTLLGVLAVYWGTAFADADTDPARSAFFLLKRFEYLLIFLVIINHVKTREWADRLLAVTLVTAALAVLEGFASGGGAHMEVANRISGIHDTYNTLAGFLVLNICLAAALLFATRNGLEHIGLLLLLGSAVLCLFFTYSREGYIMLVTSLAFLGGLRYRALLVLIVAVMVAAPWILPAPVLERAEQTVDQIQSYETADAGTNGLTARVVTWQGAFRKWIQPSPVLGVGVGNVPLSVDNEYVTRMSETGAVGLAAFLWLLWSIGSFLRRAYRASPDARSKAVTGACLAGFLALLIQGAVAPAFTTIRTMEAFYLLLGLAWVYHHLPAAPECAGESERAAAPDAALRRRASGTGEHR